MQGQSNQGAILTDFFMKFLLFLYFPVHLSFPLLKIILTKKEEGEKKKKKEYSPLN